MQTTVPLEPSVDPAYAVIQSRGSDLAWLFKHLNSLLFLRPARLLRRWWQRQQERDQLLALDDRMLRDIGISRADAVGEWRKPFWQD